ncbi:MAG TPA: translation initiation factor IF-2 [Candidatus Ozemobacteraceae bacterium]|nr:translation initiation factor IF-2 [Candidatus Ozemobacteraceae bacterium]
MRLHELSKQYNVSNKDLATLLGKLGFQVKEHPFTSVSDEMLEALRKHFEKGKTPAAAQPQAPAKPAATAPQPPQQARPAAPVQPAPQPRPAQPPAQATRPVQPPVQPQRPPQSAPQAQQPRPAQPAPQAQQPQRPAAPSAQPVRDDKKKLGPKPPRLDEVEEVEVNQQITIIKTTPVKKEAPPQKLKKKKDKIKKLMKGPHVPKKLLAELRDTEKLAELETETQLQMGGEASGEEQIPRVIVPQDITVSDLAKYLHIEGVEIVKKLMSIGVFASLNQRLEPDQVQVIGREFGKDIAFSNDVIEFEEEPDEASELHLRPPVVTIMGHVDHGKTSLLDKIRHSRVAEGEVGGITQHIGAYQVKTPNGTICFLDTPGHEAFTAMRAQGAQVTDIAILVVAADDGVQPQTIEAIHHAQAANVPIIVAINKVDKPEANQEKVKQMLMPYNLVAEDWGGKTIMVPVSAKRGDGIDELLEMILLQSEMMELKANPDRGGKGTIIEAKLDKGMGPIATVLVQNGTVRMGDNIICGTSFGRVKALINDAGQRVKDAPPSTPVALIGLNDVPRVGDTLMVVENAKFARYVGVLRQKKEREDRLTRENRLKLIDIFQRVTDGKVKELNIIIKADVQGSAGALKDSLERLTTAEVKVNAIHTGVGAITESDIMLAAASNAVIIGFHVRPAHGVDEIAQREGVDIKVFRIIYDAIDAVKLALKGMYEPEYQEEVVGRAEVRKVFKITGAGAIAGSYVIDGKVARDAQVRIIRDGVEIYEGKLSSLKRFKDDVREVMQGYECGIGVANYNDLKEKDVVEFFRLKEIERAV